MRISFKNKKVSKVAKDDIKTGNKILNSGNKSNVIIKSTVIF